MLALCLHAGHSPPDLTDSHLTGPERRGAPREEGWEQGQARAHREKGGKTERKNERQKKERKTNRETPIASRQEQSDWMKDEGGRTGLICFQSTRDFADGQEDRQRER